MFWLSTILRKRFFILVYLCAFLIIFLNVNMSRAENYPTEKQKAQLQESLSNQTKKIQENLEKIQRLSNAQNSNETSAKVQSQESIQHTSKKPEWDGVYIVDNKGEYKSLIPLSGMKSSKLQKGSLTGKRYITITVLPQEVNHFSWENFKGFFFKGQELIQEIRVHKLEPVLLGKIFSFLSGAPGGVQYNAEDLGNNLYASSMRCNTNSDSAYCEFNNKEYIKNYLGGTSSSFCMLIIAGESPEKGGKMYTICFAE